MGLRHAVVTSVDRDDLPDGGANHFAAVIAAIHQRNPGTAVEVLTPDFRRVPDALDVVLRARPEVFSHNMETVPRLYRAARPGSRYDRSLALLAEAAARRDRGEHAGRVKTGIMVGIGETRSSERDARESARRVEILHRSTCSAAPQAGRPLVHPDEFAPTAPALSLGFAHCEAGPLVRSSYHSHAHAAGAAAAAAAT